MSDVGLRINIDPAIKIKVGSLHLTGCRVTESSKALRTVFDRVVDQARKRFTDMPLGEHPVAGGIRRLFKSLGMDPSRYRPSAEALVRRVLKNQDLYHINCIVDINNICSMESLYPLGVYDRERINGDVNVRLGTAHDIYRGIGREINIAGKLVCADADGAFGSPIADSARTKITEHTRELLVLLYAPPSAEDSEVRDTLKRFAELADAYAGAVTKTSEIRASS